jgi:hypothetical protein
MYVGSGQEAALIGSVRMAAAELDAALTSLLAAGDCAVDDTQFAARCRAAATHLEATVRAIDRVRTDVSADYFAQVMRPFFEDITVDGRQYFGPAAAHLPLFLVDHLLWSADRGVHEHAHFQLDAATYSPSAIRRAFHVWRGRSSLVTRVVAALAEPSPVVLASADAVCELQRILIVFRGRHLVLARAAYDAERRLYPRGSGGGTVALLEHILQLTRTCADGVKSHPKGGSARC